MPKRFHGYRPNGRKACVIAGRDIAEGFTAEGFLANGSVDATRLFPAGRTPKREAWLPGRKARDRE